MLREIAGVEVQAFRACTWSVTQRSPWAVDELLRSGVTVDSSIFPVWHPDYGVRHAPNSPYLLNSESGELLEFPPLCLDFSAADCQSEVVAICVCSRAAYCAQVCVNKNGAACQAVFTSTHGR